MELKKSPKADLENKRTYFLQIGFILALAFAIGMFGMSQKERVVQIQEQEVVVRETEMTEITVQDDKRPPAPIKTQAVAISEIINLVDDDEVIEETTLLDLDVTQLAVNVQDFGGTYTGGRGARSRSGGLCREDAEFPGWRCQYHLPGLGRQECKIPAGGGR